MLHINHSPRIELLCPPDPDDFEDCPMCDGRGWVEDIQDFGDTTVSAKTYCCHFCDGQGWIKVS